MKIKDLIEELKSYEDEDMEVVVSYTVITESNNIDMTKKFRRTLPYTICYKDKPDKHFVSIQCEDVEVSTKIK